MNKGNNLGPKFLLCIVLIIFSFNFLKRFNTYDSANRIFTVCFVFVTLLSILWAICSGLNGNLAIGISAFIAELFKGLLIFVGGYFLVFTGWGTKTYSSEESIFSSACLVLGVLLIFYIILRTAYKIYEFFYYRGEKFVSIRQQIRSYINDCNELNEHIEQLKISSLLSNRVDYGQATYQDNSRWKYKRKYLNNQKYAPNIHNCSRTVCDSARKKPFEYVCKYFGIKANEENLSQVEEILNNFEAAEDGKIRLQKEKTRIIESIKTEIPFLIRAFSKRLDSKLGFEEIDMSDSYFPEYIFQYTSSGGNASMRCSVVFDLDNLNKFVMLLSEKIKFRKSIAGQRALMTSKLREKIKERDNYTCKICGASVENEPNLLLEIDHIIPVSKGGLTTEDNLQTLCWRCNRSKGAKIS